mmetsp:Transcript_10202/g.28009  ORF Transcript_10202/g.28009 Transcript_10202/m.28009 type:complete len:213 (-) Transcript_10202:175-813(-)|eukprot:CAMPEP_0198133926 /NCGR_PEP_ID=MMETSP1442-20131203/59818_1 /TAXON_ID= /ORGANISM="Craspedostauros australis, Strain CCMP3328" /LENGTH=212 /DNA_ID=CAMNT_0043795061 /DNA_START=545 /DNA_END=1183 /DNA_ORIENTATION=+
MAPIHIPRVLTSIARGYQRTGGSKLLGLGHANAHTYTARVGIVDVDYLGHMNHAAFLSHAEYARWELMSENGLLKTALERDTHLVVSAAAIRYRQELRPLFRKFVVESYVGALDERNLWIFQNFRYPEEANNRIRGQVLLQGVAVKDREVIDPRELLKDHGYDADFIDSIAQGSPTETPASVGQMRSAFEKLDEAFRQSATEDDLTKMKPRK